MELGDVVSLVALAGALLAGLAALIRIGPERQTTIVGAQDTVIDNLREEVARHKTERDEEFSRYRTALQRADDRRRADVRRLEAALAMETASCEERIGRLEIRLRELEAGGT